MTCDKEGSGDKPNPLAVVLDNYRGSADHVLLAVMPSKIKIKTAAVQWIKSRIWEIKRGNYANTLTKIQVGANFHMRDFSDLKIHRFCLRVGIFWPPSYVKVDHYFPDVIMALPFYLAAYPFLRGVKEAFYSYMGLWARELVSKFILLRLVRYLESRCCLFKTSYQLL